MIISDGQLIFLGIQVVGWVVAVAVIKTDTNWIKSSLRSGDRRFSKIEGRLNNHNARISSIMSGCKARHEGVVFPQVENGGGTKE